MTSEHNYTGVGRSLPDRVHIHASAPAGRINTRDSWLDAGRSNYSNGEWVSLPLEPTSTLLRMACDTKNVNMTKQLVNFGVGDDEQSDGTTGVHMAFGHQCVEIVKLFLGLESQNDQITSIKRMAESIAISIRDDDDASQDLRSAIKQHFPKSWGMHVHSSDHDQFSR